MFKSFYSPLIRRSVRRADAIIVSGIPLIDTAELIRDAREKCVVIPFGIDAVKWNRLSTEDRSEIERIRSKHPRLILAVGRLVSYKGFHVLAEAMREIDAELWIAGTGPLRQLIGQRAAAAGAGERVHFLGDISDEMLRRLYHAARVLAFPSISGAETFGLVQLEAMACGLPIVNTSLNTMVPLVARHGQEALTVLPHDPGALASALRQILDHDGLRDRLGHAASARVTTAYRLDHFLQSTANLYMRLLTGKVRQ
jgi:rhamnosyl/mannosyltransferase